MKISNFSNGKVRKVQGLGSISNANNRKVEQLLGAQEYVIVNAKCFIKSSLKCLKTSNDNSDPD